jgi:hypothetical protein
MDMELCPCGNCILTVDEWMDGLIAKLDSLDSDRLYSFAQEHLGMDVEHHSDGPYFRWKMDQVNLIEGLDALEVLQAGDGQ